MHYLLIEFNILIIILYPIQYGPTENIGQPFVCLTGYLIFYYDIFVNLDLSGCFAEHTYFPRLIRIAIDHLNLILK